MSLPYGMGVKEKLRKKYKAEMSVPRYWLERVFANQPICTHGSV
jgi:hypothetical protein